MSVVLPEVRLQGSRGAMPWKGQLRVTNKQALNTKSWGCNVSNQHKKITRGRCASYRNASMSAQSSTPKATHGSVGSNSETLKTTPHSQLGDIEMNRGQQY